MALKVKAVEKNIKFDKNSEGVWRYVMQPDLYIALSQAKVIKEAALRSGVSQGVMKACWDAAGEVIKAWGYGRPFETFHLIRKVRDSRHAQHRLR